MKNRPYSDSIFEKLSTVPNHFQLIPMIRNISIENHHANFIHGAEVLILCFSIKANVAMLLG